MKKKQVAGLLVAVILFVTLSYAGTIAEKQADRFLDMLENGAATSLELPTDDYFGVVQVTGTIANVGSSTLFSEVQYDHNAILSYIDQLIDSKTNKGMILYIDSPGGITYDIDELYVQLKKYKDTGRPIIAYCASYACSGGYYIAMTADEIYANRNSTIGGIGCRISLYDYSELLSKLGIKEVNITSGVNKAMGSGGTELTEEQRGIYQSLVDEEYDYFLDVISEGRQMDREQVKTFSDGRVFSTKQALANDMIDHSATYEECVKDVRKKYGSDLELYYPEDNQTLSSLFSQMKQMIPKSDSQVLHELMEKQEKGGLMYYADLS